MALFSLDSNVLIYSEGTDDSQRRDIASGLIAAIGRENIVLPVQAIGETLRWLIGKGGLSQEAAVQRIEEWMEQCRPLPLGLTALAGALQLVSKHHLQIWDAVILSASSDAGARIVFSEDMQHGFTWGGVTVINPFVLTAEERRMLLFNIALH